MLCGKRKGIFCGVTIGTKFLKQCIRRESKGILILENKAAMLPKFFIEYLVLFELTISYSSCTKYYILYVDIVYGLRFLVRK